MIDKMTYKEYCEADSDKRYEYALAYAHTEEYSKICEPYLVESERLLRLIHQHTAIALQALKIVCTDGTVARKEYSRGGMSMHRGYYCPSPVQDLFIGNINRGKLLKKVPIKKPPDYVYSFDSGDHLILADGYEHGYAKPNREVIMKYDSIEYGYRIDEEDNEIAEISEAIYSGRQIQEYTLANGGRRGNPIYYRKEIYSYNTCGISCCEVLDFFGSRTNCGFAVREGFDRRLFDVPHVGHDKYYFNHDDDGYVSGFTRVEYWIDDSEIIVPNDDIIEIPAKKTIKRKV